MKYAISRDIKDEDIDQMMQKLADWDASSSEVLKSVEEKMKLAKDNYDVEQERRKEHAAPSPALGSPALAVMLCRSSASSLLGGGRDGSKKGGGADG